MIAEIFIFYFFPPVAKSPFPGTVPGPWHKLSKHLLTTEWFQVQTNPLGAQILTKQLGEPEWRKWVGFCWAKMQKGPRGGLAGNREARGHVQKPWGSVMSGMYIRRAAGDCGTEDVGGDQVMGMGNGVPSECWDCLPLSLYFPNFNQSNFIISIFHYVYVSIHIICLITFILTYTDSLLLY